MYKKVLLPLLLLSILSTIQLLGHSLEEYGVPPQPSHFVKGNWNHVMDPHGCVILNRNDELIINIHITVATNDFSLVPDMYYTTQFYGGPQSALIGPIESNDFVFNYLPTGELVYTFTDRIYFGEFQNECANDPNTPIPFEYNLTLRDVNGDPYPIDDYAHILTLPYISDPDGNGLPIIPSIVYEGVNNLCCFGSTDVPEIGLNFVENTGTSVDAIDQTATAITSSNDAPLSIEAEEVTQNMMNLTKDQQPAIFPNPFKDVLNIKFPALATETTVIQLWDINGRLVQQMEQEAGNMQLQEVVMNTSQLQTGFYYCSIKNNTYSHTFKILKTAN